MESTKVKWRKIGGGSFRLGGRIIKPNEIFSASPDEIPELFLKFLVKLEKDPESPAIIRTKRKFDIVPVEEIAPVKTIVTEDALLFSTQETVPGALSEYFVEKASPGWFNIINITTGKRFNEKKLRKADAEEIIAGMNGG